MVLNAVKYYSGTRGDESFYRACRALVQKIEAADPANDGPEVEILQKGHPCDHTNPINRRKPTTFEGICAICMLDVQAEIAKKHGISREAAEPFYWEWLQS